MSNKPNNGLLWTKSEVAQQLKVSTRTVYRLVAEGFLPNIRIGRCIRIEQQAVYHFVEAQRQYNEHCAGLAVRHPKGERSCLKSARKGKGSNADPVPSFGGVLTQTQAVKEFNALLEQPTRGRR